MNGGYPLRPVESARTRPVAGIAAQPGGCQRPRPAPARGSRPASVRRSAACDSQHLSFLTAQYRLCRWSSACARLGSDSDTNDKTWVGIMPLFVNGMQACVSAVSQRRSQCANLPSLHEPGRRDRKGMARAGRYRRSPVSPGMLGWLGLQRGARPLDAVVPAARPASGPLAKHLR